jgi:hypothetical protein
VHGGVEAERVVGRAQVVVDGLRHAHDADAVVGEALRDTEGVLAADGDQRVDLVRRERLADPVDPAVDLVRVGARRAEDGAAPGEDVLDVTEPDRLGQVLDRPLPPVAEPHDLPAVGLDALADHTADDRVEAGAVATAGEHTNAHLLSQSLLVAWVTQD